MNDKIIINTISKLHFIIVSALSFIFVTLSILFVLLQNGVYIENISLPNIQVKKLYIKWNEKLNITLNEVTIVQDAKKQKSQISPEQVKKFFKFLLLFDNWFEKIEINKIDFNDIRGSFSYLDGQSGFLIASSDDFSLHASLFFESHLFNVKIDELQDYKRNIKVSGNIIFDGYNKIELIASLDININDDMNLHLYSLVNKEKLLYKVNSKDGVKDIKHTIEMLGLGDAINYWAYDAIKMSDAQLKYLYGFIEYDKISEAYKNVKLSAVVNNLHYTYNPALSPIVSKQTELEFNNGVFTIRPKQAYQYGFYLNKSYIEIDFTKKEELLNLFLLFNAKLNKDILYLLKTYGINLPFLQHSGDVDVNLNIEIGLREIDVKTKGIFTTQKANFDYLGLNIDIFNAKILLDNYDVSINNMHAKYLDIATADVDVKFNAKENKGVLDFRAQDINFKDIGLKLVNSKSPLKISYEISNDKDIIRVQNSTWQFKNQNIEVDRVTLPFDIETLTAHIPTTPLKIDSLASAYASGTFSINPIRANLDVDLLSFTLGDMKMNQSSAYLKVKYDENITISSNEKIRFDANGLDYVVTDVALAIDEKSLTILDSSLEIKNLASAKFDLNYTFKSDSATVKLRKLHFKEIALGEIFSSKDEIKLQLISHKGEIAIKAKEFDIDFILRNRGWELKFNSLDKVAKQSKLLQEYSVNNGDFTLYKNTLDKNIHFLAHTTYPYKLLVLDNQPIENYILSGEVDSKSKDISLSINDSLNITIDKNIEVTADKIGINIDEVLHFFNDQNTTNSKEGKNIIFNATDSYIYISKDRHAISDTIELQYFNGVVSAQLKHKQGNSGFELQDGKFYLYGEKFGDEFMDKLFALSKFKDGELSFSMAGTTQEYDGLMQVKDTTILDYKILNNILAFVNTIPSLVTFSVPGYSKNGLEVKRAYMNFHTKDDIFNIDNISLDSKEMDIVGRGTASFKYNTINLELNLKTDLGSSIAKIPLVGYILLGEDSISTSMEITGKLNDPEVRSLIAKDIVVAPLNIIKRTLLLPFHLFTSDEKE